MRRLALTTILIGTLGTLTIAPAPAEARYYGHYGGHHGGYHGGHHRYRHHGGLHYRSSHSYRHRYHGGYRHHRPYYRSYRHHGGHHSPLYSLLSVPAHVAYAALKVPAAIVGGLTGHGHRDHGGPGGRYHPDDGGVRGGDGRAPGTDGAPPANTAPPGNGNGGTQGRYEESNLTDNWDALAQGAYRHALRGFGDAATAAPRTGKPKVGYALAAALGGDLDRGAWAMKRALRADPEALEYLQLDAQLEPAVAALIDRYQARGDDADAVLMTASLHVLRGDEAAAGQILAQHGQYRDRSEFLRLAALVDSGDRHDRGHDRGAGDGTPATDPLRGSVAMQQR